MNISDLEKRYLDSETVNELNGKKVELKTISGKEFSGVLIVKMWKDGTAVKSITVKKHDNTIAIIDQWSIEWINQLSEGD